MAKNKFRYKAHLTVEWSLREKSGNNLSLSVVANAIV